MIARLQRLVVYFLVATLVAAGWYSSTTARWIWLALAVAVVIGTYVLVLAFEFWLLRRSAATNAEIRPTDLQLCRSWLAEVFTAPAVFLWRQPFRSRAIDDFVDRRGASGGVVLVHGFFCNRGLWNPWMPRLLKLDIPFVAVTMEPPFGSIDRCFESIDSAVRSLEGSTSRRPLLVGHSMGGLAIRAWLARQREAASAYRVVTIGTPHRGTYLARHSRTRNGKEMRVGSPWLEALAAAEPPGSYERFICFWSPCDNIVFPTSTATLPGADNRELQATPHVAMAYHPAVFEEVVRLARGEAAEA